VHPREAAADLPVPAAVVFSTDAGARARLALEGERLATRWAPAFLQHTSPRHPERDRPVRVDFDGDWDATNNWSNLDAGALQQRPAVYYSAVLSETHVFLTYTLFYPRDWIPIVCVSYACHDNDLEVVMVVAEREGRAEREGSADPGRLVFVESKFHTKYVAERAAALARTPDGRPMIEIESEGHGMTPAPAKGELALEDVVLLREASAVALPSSSRSETYELLPLADTLWARRRTDASEGRLWTPGDLGWLSYSGVRFGRLGEPLGATMAGLEYRGGVRPPWGIDPHQNRGDWFFDPAFGALSRHRGFFEGRPVSLDYAFNPYVEDLRNECAGDACTNGAKPPSPGSLPATVSLAAVGLLLLGFRRRTLSNVSPVSRPG
jgi:hypothetical protein